MKNRQMKNPRVASAQRRRSWRPSIVTAPYDASIDSDIALIKELLALVTASPTTTISSLPATTTTTASPAAAKAEKQARLEATVRKIQEISTRIQSPLGRNLIASLSVESLSEYEERNAAAVVKIARAA
ncbi:hypothetical protein T484DRAFT_1918185 [Baffinella frigidus]|nr:hypothetical protein T484DRAFT_1918185 [Cryptophyta sp. CCMP2293]